MKVITRKNVQDSIRENIRKKVAGCILLAAGFALLAASRISHDFAQWYSVHIYPLWVGTFGRAAGILPCSLSELLLYALLLWVLVTGAVRFNRIVRRKEDKRAVYGWLWTLFLIGSLLFFLYEMNCGVNYHRQSFSESSGILVREYSKDELREVCLTLTEEVNSLSGKVTRDNTGCMKTSDNAGVEAVKAMQNLGTVYAELKGYYPRPKGLLVPWILAVQNLTGIYSPFTVEANYNSSMTDYNIPFTMCHELSHLRGFMHAR